MRRHRRPVDARQRLEHDLAKREQRAGVAGGDHAGGLAGGHRVDREAHRGLPRAQRRGRLHVVADHVRRMPDGAGRPAPGDAWPADRVSCGSSPTSRKRAFGWRSAASSSPSRTMPGALSPPMASIASVKVSVTIGTGHAQAAARRSGADSALQRLAGRDDLAAIVVAAMAADVVRTLQLAAVGALGVRLVRQRLMAAAHAAAGRRGLSLRNSHGTAPPCNWLAPRSGRGAFTL